MPTALPPPEEWDELPLLGVGRTAEVRVWRQKALKLALPGAEARARLRREVALHAELKRAGIPVPRLFGARRDGRALLRELLPEPLGARANERQKRAAFDLVQRARTFPVRLDLSPSNFYWRRGQLILGDAGERLAPRVFRSETYAGFLREWRAWEKRQGRSVLLDVAPPPSGRFHVETPVGPARGAKLLWKNVGALSRLGARWNDAVLLALGNQMTFARPTTTRVSTRYVDMLALDRANGPKGDGRAVLLGTWDGKRGTVPTFRRAASKSGDSPPFLLGVKGCGPTPLTWKGTQFHDDGFVSFPRTLWEVTVADELARLGFDTTEYLAVLSTGKTTVDNTKKRWPAAAGLRAMRTNWRLGHLRRVCHRPAEFRSLLAHIGRELLGEKWTAKALALQFAKNLGHDIGRTDALQIHCFNPTPGNVRLDGHPIDFSTVRFFRHYVPEFKFLENRYAVRIHKLVWLRLVRMLVEVMHEGGAVGERDGAALDLAARRAYLAAYRDGFGAGLARFLGLERKPSASVVELTQRLRELRGPRTLHFKFWRQSVPEPLFDLVGRAPAFVAAVKRGADEPWKALRARADLDVPADAARLADRWTAAIRPLLGGPARNWDHVIRPFMEPEALAKLLYLKSTPRNFRRWQELISTSRHLPEGNHGHRAAREHAQALGHVIVETLRGERHPVIGLTPELHAALRRALRAKLGRNYVGAVVHGSRVGPRPWGKRAPVVREFGPAPGRSSDLDLKIFVRPKALGKERDVGAALAQLGAWFPLTGHAPPWQRLIATPAREVEAAFRAWNGGPRRALLGKGRIPLAQAAVLDRAP